MKCRIAVWVMVLCMLSVQSIGAGETPQYHPVVISQAKREESDLSDHENRKVQEECDLLLNALLPFAHNQLKKNGLFYPFGAVMNNNGDVATTALGVEFASAETDKMIDALIRVHSRLASEGNIKASGIAYDVKVTLPENKKTDAIAVRLEHASGYSVVVLQPYCFGFLKKLILDDLLAQSGTHEVFQPSVSD